ncbi:putative RNA-binding protein [Zootermopsis nevadensis]|uniref:Putative RNA-binding protein n=1 Tax=Zootermopsis nevadensis TaxID=136037 RepID=A0A067QFK0_ZOONE|nr:putative RNA-binding protein [Zootermopsis nevadensis]
MGKKEVKQTISHNISQSSNAELLGKSYKKTILFEDSSDVEEEGNLKVKPQFEGVKGQKLLELQSRFASDNRFALDERFYESDEEVCAEASDSVQTARVEDERRRQFEILKDVLGHPIPIKEDKKDKSKRVPMLRFDPTKPDHAKFEKKTEPKIKRKVPDNSTDKEPKVVYDTKEEKIQNVASTDKEPKVVCDTEEEKIQNVAVSKEKFYKVAKSLKETLQKRDEKNEFSLRKLFGASDGDSDDKETGETYSAITLNKHKQKEWTKNPFKYDSNDSEEENENITHNKTDNSQQNVHENLAHSSESFFFKLNDVRLHG